MTHNPLDYAAAILAAVVLLCLAYVAHARASGLHDIAECMEDGSRAEYDRRVDSAKYSAKYSAKGVR